jgi:hypothetical protein
MEYKIYPTWSNAMEYIYLQLVEELEYNYTPGRCGKAPNSSGSILDAARCAVLRPVHTLPLCTWVHRYTVQVPQSTATPYRVLDGVIVFIL